MIEGIAGAAAAAVGGATVAAEIGRAMKRAGADIIMTYSAKRAAKGI